MVCVEIFFLVGVIIQLSFGNDYIINNKKFPANFSFGCSTSAFQIEGAWNEDGKAASWWDDYTHQDPTPVLDGSTADIACDSYHQYETDIALLKELGATHYRFSISWPRILPNGLPESLNQAGVQYYKNLIKALLDNNIIPLVTLYHWDIPLVLFDQGGMINETFITWFSDYARVCFQQFGDDVKYWTTFNEAVWGCLIFIPLTTNEYICTHNVLRAHAAAWHVYNNEFREKQQGYVSMVHATTWFGPASNSTEDIEAAERKMQFDLGLWTNPIYLGDYPDIVKERAKERIPVFTDAEKALLKGTSDFISVNTYVSQLVKNHPYPEPPPEPTREYEESVDVLNNTDYPDGAWGLLPLSRWIKSHYGDTPIVITENGLYVDDPNESIDDDNRISVIEHYLSAILDAIDEGINFRAYSVWSLMDNFEWSMGYSRRYGIYQVDFNSPNRTRTPKKSAKWYKNVIAARCLVDNCVE